MNTASSELGRIKKLIANVRSALRPQVNRLIRTFRDVQREESADLDTETGIDWLKRRQAALLTPSGEPLAEFREIAAELSQEITNFQRKASAEGQNVTDRHSEQARSERSGQGILSTRRDVAMNVDESTLDATEEVSQGESPRIELRGFAVLNGITELGRKKGPRKVVVPLGQIFVVAYDFNTYGLRGIPEVYLAGEKILKDELRKDQTCLVFALPEFPGMVYVRAQQPLPAISQTSDDVARLEVSFHLRISKPVLLLERLGSKLGVKGSLGEQAAALTADIERTIKDTLKQVLSSKLQMWSSDEDALGSEILSRLDEGLSRWGLRVDSSDSMNRPIVLLREFPSTLYEIALQFARGEKTLFNMLNSGTNQRPILKDTGLTERHVVILQERKHDPSGVTLFALLTDASDDTKKKVSKWLENQGLGKAAKFLRDLYFDGEIEERNIKLSEQVLLAAIKNPMLTRGEWLKRGEEIDISAFQRMETRIRTVMAAQEAA